MGIPVSEKTHKIICLFFSVFLFLLSILILYLLYVSHKEYVKLKLFGVKTTAKVIECKLKRVRGGSLSSSGYSYVTTIAFKDRKGQLYIKEISFDLHCFYKKGDIVNIIYDKDMPYIAIWANKSFWEVFSDYAVFILLSLMFFGGSIYFFWFRNHYKS